MGWTPFEFQDLPRQFKQAVLTHANHRGDAGHVAWSRFPEQNRPTGLLRGVNDDLLAASGAISGQHDHWFFPSRFAAASVRPTRADQEAHGRSGMAPESFTVIEDQSIDVRL